MQRTFTASLAALSLAGTLALASSPASASGWNHHWNGPLAAGVVGGLALGAVAGGGYPSAAYYVAPAYEGCYFARRPIYDGWGEFVGYRRVRVCE
jgi:hypothetical protein